MSEVTPEVQAEARAIGWKPQEEFRGDAAHWVDADEYLRRGREVLPLVKAENRRLQESQTRLQSEITRLAAVVEEQRESMNSMAEFSLNELRDRLAEQKKALTAQLRAARREDDDALVENLEEQLDANKEKAEKLKAPTPTAAPVASPAPAAQETPEFKAWKDKNPWYGGSSRADQAKTAAAHRFAQEAASRGLRGAAFFDDVDEALAEVYPPQRRSDPTEDGRPSGGGGSSSSSDKGFNALPAEARAKAREQVAKFVGPNKMFKDEKAWFTYYAKQYNATEA